MLMLESDVIKLLINKIGLKEFYFLLFANLTEDFTNWQQFQKTSRHALYVPNGVIELMPICNDKLYSFKYVNGHPANIKNKQLTVVAFGVLADVVSGYPLLLAAMTMLTAIRTAAIAALASSFLAQKDSKKLAIIGCGAQSEFQVTAHHALFDLEEVRYFDINPIAMQRFHTNLSKESFKLIPAENIIDAITGVDIIITATACKQKQRILELDMLAKGQHIVAIGGDSIGKTELCPNILRNSKVVVEYFEQTLFEGEIQNLEEDAYKFVYAELWEIISKAKVGRVGDEITVFDSVGFALEDFSILRLCFDLARQYNLGEKIDLIPLELEHDLYGGLAKRI